MRYTPDAEGNFSGQSGYGYKSLEEFVVASTKLRETKSLAPRYVDLFARLSLRCIFSLSYNRHFDKSLATIWSTLTSTAILEAGRKSLDDGGRTVNILFDDSGVPNGYS
jgi:D-galacturonate reductase